MYSNNHFLFQCDELENELTFVGFAAFSESLSHATAQAIHTLQVYL